MDINTRRPAIIPAEHPDQRYYAETRGHWNVHGAALRDHMPSVRVYRRGAEDTAELSIELIGAFHVRSHLTPDALRRLASDLLDAALDIEQHPAAALEAAARKAELAPPASTTNPVITRVEALLEP